MRRLLVAALAVAALAMPTVPRSAAATAAAPRRIAGYVTTRDGTQLRYTAIVPAGDGRYPALLEYSGYEPGTVPDKDYVARFVPRGYAFVGVNLRGTGCSGGTWDAFQPAEGTDGYDVVEWIARQPWSNQRVAMIGKSYPGITQLYVGAERPPHLVAIAPGHVFGDIYRDLAYPGGILNWAFYSLWSFLGQPYQSYSGAYADSTKGDDVCARHAGGRLSNHNPFVDGVQHPWNDEDFRQRSPDRIAGRINVPIWFVDAWQDEQVGSRAVELLRKFRSPTWALLTNGDHGMYRTELALAELTGFLDHFVKGIDNGFERTPRIRVWWESGRDGHRAPGWVTSIPSWPPPTRPWTMPLGAGASGAPDAYAYSGPTGQGIQNMRYSTVLTQPDRYLWDVKPAPGTALAYQSAPLPRSLTALGSASLDVWLASTAPDTDVQATLTELRPDGQEVYVQSGWLRASHRHLDTAASTRSRPVQTHLDTDAAPLPPGEPSLLRLEIFPFGHVFRAGSRVRVWIEGPKFLPELWGFASLPVPAVNLVYHDAAHPSALVLPELTGVRPLRGQPPCGAVIRQPCRAG